LPWKTNGFHSTRAKANPNLNPNPNLTFAMAERYEQITHNPTVALDYVMPTSMSAGNSIYICRYS